MPKTYKIRDMSMKVIIEDPNESARAALEKIYKKQGLGFEILFRASVSGSDESFIRLLSEGPDAASGKSHHFTKPVRAGAVLAAAQRLAESWRTGSDYITFGGHKLNVISHELAHENGKTLRLTEKESHILRLLSASLGQTVNRKTLLEQVWQYAENAETHTLETHIYRLRRKIEADPANPSLLLTDGAGYRLVK
jgi:hypothetical protein